TFDRPAYQCVRISTTSTIVNVLLPMSPPSIGGRRQRWYRRTGPGTRARPRQAREAADRGGRELPDRRDPVAREVGDRLQPVQRGDRASRVVLGQHCPGALDTHLR